ncbi:MAG: phage integrase family protein, partial [Microvirga sp.]|nr:phage integrase family protein [Microvirga sp.]
MPPAHAYALEPEVDLLAAYVANCSRLGLTGVNLPKAAASFLRRWPDPQQWADEPMQVRLAASADKRAFVMFLMLTGHLRPGYDYLVRRKLPTFWRDLPPGPIADDLDRFLTAAGELGFTERTRSGVGSQVIGRLLIQTGRRLDALVDGDFDDLLAASAARHGTQRPNRHYSSAVHTARQVLFHLGILIRQPVNATSL